MVAHQLLEKTSVFWGQAHPPRNPSRYSGACFGMIYAGPFPDVVQESAEKQEVRPAYVPYVSGRVGHRLEKVPVDAPAVVGVELGLVADMAPLGHVAFPDPQLVQCLDGMNGGRAKRQELEEGAPYVFRPRNIRCRSFLGQAGHGRPGQWHA